MDTDLSIMNLPPHVEQVLKCLYISIKDQKSKGKIKELLCKAKTVVRFNQILNVCRLNNDIQCVFNVFEQMKSKNLEPDVVTYSTLITSCANEKNLTKALQIFQQMKSKNLEPNVVTYSTLITCCANQKNLTKALQIFEQMKSKKLEPDVVTYNTLITCCIRTRNSKTGRTVLNELIKKRIKMDEYTFSAIFKLISLENKPNPKLEADKWYSKMEQMGIERNMYIEEAYLKAITPRVNRTTSEHTRKRRNQRR